MELVGAWRLPLRVGQQTTLDLVFTNVSNRAEDIVSLSISLNRWVQVDGGVENRVFGTLATLDPIGVTLAPGASYTTSVLIMPTVSGTFEPRFTPLYRDVNQEFGSHQSYYDFTVLPAGG